LSEPETNFGERDGKLFVTCARESMSKFLIERRVETCSALVENKRYSSKRGCFVTLRDKQKSLRGCIGFPEPVYQLPKALTLSAISAATEDPRFPPVGENELAELTIEVSILTPPKILLVDDPRKYPEKIVIGKDGLILKWPFGSGLLLPQVPVEENWTPEEFLSNLSMKAGALPDQWLLPETQIEKFGAQVFEELRPGGEVSSKL
jgi:uncharacterized protein